MGTSGFIAVADDCGERAREVARETEAAADAISEPPEPGLDSGGDAIAYDGASGASARAAGAPPPAPPAAVGTGRAGDGDPDATEAALAAARGAAAAAGATIGEEEAFPKSMTIAERLKKEPALGIEGKKVDIPNLIIMGKLVVYNKSVLKDDEEATVGEMYPIFMGLPAVYLVPKSMAKVSPGSIYQVAKDWHDYKAAFYFLYRPTGGSAVAVCVFKLLEKSTAGKEQDGSKEPFVVEFSPMKLLTSPALERDDDFVLAGGPLVKEWSVTKKQGRSSRRAEAAKAAAEKERAAADKERAAAEKAAEKEAKAASLKGASAASKKPKKGATKEIPVDDDDDEDEDEDEDDDLLAPFKDKAWLKKTMVSKNQVNRRAPLREQLETIVRAGLERSDFAVRRLPLIFALK